MDSHLDRLAKKRGICLTRPSPDNVEVPITDATKLKVLAALGVYGKSGHRPLKKQRSKAVLKSYLPDVLEMERLWGISLQLYELRSSRNWGIGDFADLAEMIRLAHSLGADFVGLNPLHAPFLADPDRCSPYEPSNRQMLNPLYIAVDQVAGFQTTPEVERQLQELRLTDLVDYVRVAEVKLAALRMLWQSRHASASGSTDRDGFEDFIQDRGQVLRPHALFETLSAVMGSSGNATGWKSWPPEFQRPDSVEVTDFAEAHADTIRFHMWLQWLAHLQLSGTIKVAKDAGLRIGLYFDLAVGEAIDGSATWSERNAYISDATVGSPPDPFAMEGQDWHLAAFIRWRLRWANMPRIGGW